MEAYELYQMYFLKSGLNLYSTKALLALDHRTIEGLPGN